ncbi:hypothetical protein DFQ27_004579 [Actinomortierella ambigua]|uniref:Uncharacterized protein n=1 Tax=Actinomortierella ambigua TaxID=1343610 RepID=A0A9P6QK29_9FUNG|nr:hypothetical protein DFQ27_004579 [Actinomortierella ambigua]
MYNDHVHDPVCIYEHELQPEMAAAQVQPPILVHSMSDEQIMIPLEEDPTVAPPPVSIGQDPETTAMMTTRSTGEAFFSSYTQHDLDLELGNLPPPPSYDTPNRVVEVSPLPMPASAHIPMTDYFDPHAMASSSSLSSASSSMSSWTGGDQLPPSPHYSLHPTQYHRTRARAHSDLANYYPADPNALWTTPPRPLSPAIQRAESTPISHGRRLRLSLSISGGFSRRSGHASPPPASWTASSTTISTLPAPAVAEIRSGRYGSGRPRSSTVSGETPFSPSSSSPSSRLWVQQFRRAFAQRSSNAQTTSSSSLTSSLETTTVSNNTPSLAEAAAAAVSATIGETPSQTRPSEDVTIITIDQPQVSNVDNASVALDPQPPDLQSTPQSPPQPQGEELCAVESAARRTSVMSTSGSIISASPPLPMDSSLVSSFAVPTLALSAA